jgi:predicted nucleotidyltransferase
MATSTGLSPAEARLLTALLRVDTPLSGRALARVTGLTQSTAGRALARLREAGLVVAEPAPPSLLYRPNSEHLSMPALLALLRVEEELRTRLADAVAGWQLSPASVVVFGSVARGEATAASDLDVLVVRPDAIEPDLASWQAQLADLADRLHGWTGRRASVIDLSRRETIRGLADREPFLVAADRDGWLIAGSALHDLAEPST